MNYGHSFGHALESLSGYRIPHGVAVTLGILVENDLSLHRGMLPLHERNRLLEIAKRLIPLECASAFSSVDLSGILELLRRDKKAEGAVLKVATIERIGLMRFIDLPLDANGEREVRQAVQSTLDALSVLVCQK
jgi:3-dehydroquinate synthase